MKILIINGPNLNLLGKREPEIYGNELFSDYITQLEQEYSNIDIEYYQSNVEGFIIDKMHEVGFCYDGIILNAGAYTHTSVALLDCIKAIDCPVVEVHISNIFNRESFRHNSIISPACVGVIAGFGLKSYKLALEWFVK